MKEKRYIRSVAIALGAVVLFFLFFNIKSIDAGERGILYNTFSGAISEDVKGPGVHLYFSWYDLYVYDLRITETKHTMSVLSKNGLDIQIELSIRYQPQEDKLNYIFTNIGRDQTAYYEKIIMPEIRSVTREVLGKFEEEEIYNSKREQVQADIFNLMKKRLGKHGLTCETVLVRDINLPTEIQTAIKTKLKEQQLALQYDYRLLREEKEKRRKIIEAEGEAEYQRIVNQHLTPGLLKLRGIEATRQLANSSNAKIVVIGGKDGLPIILNDKD